MMLNLATFHECDTKAQATKENINQLDCININNFCASKHTHKKAWRYSTEWEKISTNQISDKGSIVGTYKELLQLNNIKNEHPSSKWTKDLNRHFSKEDMQMANKHMKRCSTSLIH